MRRELPEDVRGVVFDVGETLVDETRMWSARAVAVGVTPFTLMGVLGSLIERGEDHRRLWSLLDVDKPADAQPAVHGDLYPDALACLRAAERCGLVVGIAGNQPAGVEAQLRAAGCSPHFLASSHTWGVEKPSPDFFARVVAESRLPAHSILYVGDRLDNDVLPAREAGMRTALIRRGPWGFVHSRRPEADLADLSLSSLTELTEAMTTARPAPGE
ncbi:HAD family hydrolase [Microbacterium sp. SORGH_AS_0888]|uniref:HAD family hydrolase n=1 Tax=Microbacterium sp. SORGH_AS_0888 TaxID=3041791 RepID=UPI002780B0F4|nr:HAD family hydrolase [Microbacterium sp. SORGH_AS_0888]MDQ1130290.1 FMN phosphatase YigB (HAD superfamily) [Microbacterium sp. SORGH_AS_0888]